MFESDIEKIQHYYDMAIEYILTYSFQLVGAAIIFLLFLVLANKMSRFIYKFLQAKNVDITLSQFIANLIKFIILFCAIVIVLGKIGISITPFVAAIGAASLGAGLAFQGLLSNYGAGFAIILTRPFTVGNTITVQDKTGVVKDVKLACTILVNEEKEDIIIPNKYLVGDILLNSHEVKLIETIVGISFSSDPHLAIKTIKQVIDSISEIDSSRPAIVGIDSFADSSIQIGVRFWVPTKNLYEVKYQANIAIFDGLKQAGIKIPFPQREIRILSDDKKDSL
ncbi:mechanosensitive ion channel family protein [Catenovulum maritimum]|uniref:Small-conductance mechanosensitive channel n=1 Tax=Catenovulum maritimum TaxID=1513271 RepID=A0A0J8GU41_9ALTE|nr:mechanosensitive ion channel family protein [Catenovulum maritimum]KMT64203.1 mechanosensitive ion channel protein MscS [Catenovulum maritimum]